MYNYMLVVFIMTPYMRVRRKSKEYKEIDYSTYNTIAIQE